MTPTELAHATGARIDRAAEHLPHIVVIGHLADLPSVRKVLSAVAGYYDAKIVVPANPGFGTAMGAVLSGRDIHQAR